MKKIIKFVTPVLGFFAILFAIILFTMPAMAAEPDNPNLWKVFDEDCQSVSVTNGDTTYTNGYIRHCYPPDKEQCNSHICQSTVPVGG